MNDPKSGGAEIVNLRRVRKAKTREAAQVEAARNRAHFGRPKAERDLEAAREALAARRLEGHRLNDEKESER